MSDVKLPLNLSFLCGACAACSAEIVTYPLDVSKTRLQMGGTQGMPKYNGLIHTIKTVLKNEGPLALYGGMTPAIVR